MWRSIRRRRRRTSPSWWSRRSASSGSARTAAPSCRRTSSGTCSCCCLLRQPRLRMIYVTSTPVDPMIVEYYLALLPGVIPSHARARLSLVSVGDASARPLSDKLLERPGLLRRIASLMPDPHALAPDPVQHDRGRARHRAGARHPDVRRDPRLFPLGTKTGCRRLFADEGVRHPLGVEGLLRRAAVVDAVVGMRRQRPVPEVIVKLDEGVSGEGNALVDLRDLPPSGPSTRRTRCGDRLRAMQPEQQDATYDEFMAMLAKRGGIVEERIVGRELRSPSVQMRVLPTRRGRAAVHPRPAARRSQRPELSRLRVPGRPGYAAAISRLADRGRAAAGQGGRARPVRGRLRRGARRGGRLDAVRDRDQPAQGRHHAPVPDPAVPHRRHVRRRRRRCSARPPAT